MHNGNGTQAIFERDPNVLFISSHQLPAFPGSGRATEIGAGPGVGATLNCPLPAETGDDVVVAFYEQVASRVLERFAPELILVSAGFDLMAGDPLAQLTVTPDGVRRIVAALVAAADRTAGGRIAFFLEGGYDLDNLRSGVHAPCEASTAPSAPPPIAAWNPTALGPAEAHLARWRPAFTL